MMLNMNKHELALMKACLNNWRRGINPTLGGESANQAQQRACAFVTAELGALLARIEALTERQA